jgi:hypothetical protein
MDDLFKFCLYFQTVNRIRRVHMVFPVSSGGQGNQEVSTRTKNQGISWGFWVLSLLEKLKSKNCFKFPAEIKLKCRKINRDFLHCIWHFIHSPKPLFMLLPAHIEFLDFDSGGQKGLDCFAVFKISSC